MGFVDTLIEHSDADVVMIDRRHRPGGHWLDSYPFVQLHQPSMNYGVELDPARAGPRRARRARRRLLRAGAAAPRSAATSTRSCGTACWRPGRVRFFPMCDYLGDRRFRSTLTGAETDVVGAAQRRRRDLHGLARAGHRSAAVRRRRRRHVRAGRRAHAGRRAAGRLRDHRRRQDRDGRRVLVARPRHARRTTSPGSGRATRGS